MKERYKLDTKLGTNVWAEPIDPSDVQDFVDIFNHMGIESRYLRFNQPLVSPKPELVLEHATAFATIPPEKGRGWLAYTDLPEQDDTAIGGARYVRLPDDNDTAEVAVTVRDDFQRQGIGTALLRLLAETAREDGIKSLVAIVQSGNRGALKLLRCTSLPTRRSREGSEVYLAVDLNPNENQEKP